jgi:AcrR family transcriptional regulator
MKSQQATKNDLVTKQPATREPVTKEQVTRGQERTQMQCGRILDAAEQCFIKYGFHAASMANISEAAQMSAGLIYRYFANKNAIILAIIERQLLIMRADMSALRSGSDFTALIGELFASWQRGAQKGMSPALYLEMSAEAGRDPQIAEAVRSFDRAVANEFCAWLKQTASADGQEVTDDEVRQSDFAVKCFIDGLALRTIREPKLDPAFVMESVKRFLPRLLSFRKNLRCGE